MAPGQKICVPNMAHTNFSFPKFHLCHHNVWVQGGGGYPPPRWCSASLILARTDQQPPRGGWTLPFSNASHRR